MITAFEIKLTNEEWRSGQAADRVHKAIKPREDVRETQNCTQFTLQVIILSLLCHIELKLVTIAFQMNGKTMRCQKFFIEGNR